jgi:hypothetical protein
MDDISPLNCQVEKSFGHNLVQDNSDEMLVQYTVI